MNRNEIAMMLRQWILAGKLKSKASLDISYGAINKAIADGKLFPTSFASIVCGDEFTRDKFENLVQQRRIMDGTTVKVYKKLNTLYSINMACANGDMLRFPDLGNSSVLYID